MCNFYTLNFGFYYFFVPSFLALLVNETKIDTCEIKESFVWFRCAGYWKTNVYKISLVHKNIYAEISASLFTVHSFSSLLVFLFYLLALFCFWIIFQTRGYKWKIKEKKEKGWNKIISITLSYMCVCV